MRVLLIAEACNPEWVSVPLEGWSHGRAIAGLVEAHLVTQVRNRDAILRAGLVEHRDFTAIDSEAIAAPAYKLAERLRGGGGKGWTTIAGISALTYPYFEHLVWRQFGRPLNTVSSTRDAIERHVTSADLVSGGVLIPGASAPKLVSAAQIRKMKPGSVVVDVAIDQGGCFETSHATTHADPVYLVDGVTHYCVANMPGAVPITSTYALTNATIPYVLAVADHGIAEAARLDRGLALGVNVAGGEGTHPAVAEAVGANVAPLSETLGAVKA